MRVEHCLRSPCATPLICNFFCRALFEKDKLVFAFTLATSIQVAAGTLEPALLRFMVTGGSW